MLRGASLPGSLIPSAAFLVLLGLLFREPVDWLISTWRIHPYYSHGLFMPPLAGFFLWSNRRDLGVDEGQDWGLILIFAGLGLHIWAAEWANHPVSLFALLLCLAGYLGSLGGFTALRAGALPLLLLGIAIPLPFVERLAPVLAANLAIGAAKMASAGGAEVVVEGARLNVGDGAFMIGAPCSGLRSIMAMSSLALVLAGVLDGPILRRAALFVLALPLALMANAARITALIWISDGYGTDLGWTFFDGASGAIFFVLAAFALVIAGHQMGCDVRARSNS